MPYVPEAPRTNTPTSTDADLATRIREMEEGLAGPSSAPAAGPSTKVPLTEEGVATSSSSEVGQTDTTEAAEAEARPKAPGIFSRKSSGAFNPSFAGLGIDSSVFQPGWPTVPGEFNPTIEGGTGEGGGSAPSISPTTSTPSPSTELPTDNKGKSTIRFPEGSQPSPSAETSDDGGGPSSTTPSTETLTPVQDYDSDSSDDTVKNSK